MIFKNKLQECFEEGFDWLSKKIENFKNGVASHSLSKSPENLKKDSNNDDLSL